VSQGSLIVPIAGAPGGSGNSNRSMSTSDESGDAARPIADTRAPAEKWPATPYKTDLFFKFIGS